MILGTHLKILSQNDTYFTKLKEWKSAQIKLESVQSNLAAFREVPSESSLAYQLDSISVYSCYKHLSVAVLELAGGYM